MTKDEAKTRLAAWIWAAQTLGVEASIDRLRGLVEVTAEVRLSSLKPALEACVKTSTQGYLPAPGAVIDAAKRIAERHTMNRPRVRAGEGDSAKWHGENNPQSWDRETWRAYVLRMGTDPGFARRARARMDELHAHAVVGYGEEVGRRKVSPDYRIQTMGRLDRDAIRDYGRLDPYEGGWAPPAGLDPVEALTRRLAS